MAVKKSPERVAFAVAFGKKIRAKRQSSGLSLSAINEAAGIPKGMMNGLETGRREPATWTVHTLARVFECSSNDLFPTVAEIEAEIGASL